MRRLAILTLVAFTAAAPTASARSHHHRVRAHAAWAESTALNAMHAFATQQCNNGPSPWWCYHVNDPAGCHGPYSDPQWKCWNRATQAYWTWAPDGNSRIWHYRCLYVWENYTSTGGVTGWGQSASSGKC